MESVKLTEDHKTKLLEMCIELFQNHVDYNHVEILGNNNIRLYKNYSNNKYKTYSIKGTVSIHWFEFCITHLVNVIWNKIPKYGPNHIYKDLGIKPHVHLKEYLIINCLKSHPVDYLYEQFKKL